GAALDVNHRCAQGLQYLLADGHASHVGGTVVQDARVVQHLCLHAWVLRHLKRLDTAAAPARIGDLCGIDPAEVRAAGALVLRKRPVDGATQIRTLRTRRWELSLRRGWRGRTRLPRRRTGTAQDAAA